MKKNVYLYLLPVLMFQLSCVSNTGVKTKGSSKVIELKQEKSSLASDVVEKITYIPLEQKDQSYISYIKKICKWGDKYFISDFNMKRPIQVFDEQGNYICQVGQWGRTDSEFIMMIDFCVDESYVYLYDTSQNKILRHRHNGEYVDNIKLPFRIDALQKLDNGFLFSAEKESQSSKVVVTDTAMVIQKTYIDYLENEEDNKLNDNILRIMGDQILYNKPVDNSIYIFDKDGKYITDYYLDFGKYNVPEEIRGDYEKMTKERKNGSYRYMYDAPMIYNDKLICRVFDGEDKATLICDMQSGEYCINPIIPGKISMDDIILPIALEKDMVIGYLDGSLYEILDKKPDLSLSQKQCIDNGGILLVMYTLK